MLDGNGSLIQEVYSTDPGDALQQVGPNHRSFDLTSLFQTLPGQTVQIRFERQGNLYFLDATLDNVSLKINRAPSVLVQNAQPELVLDPAGSMDENSTFHLTGTLTDQGLLDEHDVVVEWSDPNASAASTFALPATSTLVVGDVFNSTTDSEALEITAIDTATGTIRFEATHHYADDGGAPGNSTPSDQSAVAVKVNDDDGVLYSDFAERAGLALNGDATNTLTADGAVLRLASSARFETGSAFSLLPVSTADGFSTNFSFQITNSGGASDGTEPGADGFTFTLQTQGTGALGAQGGGLGYGGISPSVAVEFDTWQSATDPSSNHLGVNIDGDVVSLVTANEPLNKWDNGDIYFVWIDYDGAELQVRVNTTNARPATPNLNLAIDIPGILGQSLATVGFTAATGGAYGNHDILSWQMDDPAVAEVDLLVSNVAPRIDSLAVSAPMDHKALPGEDVSLAATFTDIGLLDRHDVTVVWDEGLLNSVFNVAATADLIVGDTFTSTSGDGAVLTVSNVVAATGEVTFMVHAHQFATGGIFDVSLTIEDDDAGAAAAEALAWVTGVRIDQRVLQIVGSTAGDQVTVNQQGTELIEVHADFLQNASFETFDTASVDQILAYLGQGDDHLTIAANVKLPAVIHGAAGNDHLYGGGGGAILLGEAGDDMLMGGTASGILIGGVGADRLVGGIRDDVLIGGTADVGDDDALWALLAAWEAFENPYEARVAAIDALLAVVDDGDEDQLTGSFGQDLFYDGVGDSLTDVSESRDLETVL